MKRRKYLERFFFFSKSFYLFLSVPVSSVTRSCLTLYDPIDCSTPGLPVHHQLPEPTQTHVHLVGDAIQPSHPLSSPSSPAFNLSQHQGLFKWVSFSHQLSKVLELQHQSFQWIFRTDFLWMDWLDLLAVQGTLKSHLQLHSSKASVLRHSALLIVQLSHPYMTTGKSIALIRRTFVGKVMSLLFSMLSRLVIVFLLRSKCLLFFIYFFLQVSFNFMAAVTICSDFGAPQNSLTISVVSHLFAMKWWDKMTWFLFSQCWVLSQLFHSCHSISKQIFPKQRECHLVYALKLSCSHLKVILKVQYKSYLEL